MLDCKRCLELNHRCRATHETEDGEPICVFCLDGIDCPIQQRQQRSATGPSPEMKASMTANLSGSAASISFVNRVRPSSSEHSKSGVTTMKTPETDTNIAPKICAKPGCTTELGPKNRSGKCADHFHWKAPGERASIAGNGHAIAASTDDTKAGNGTGNGGNGHALEATQDAPAPQNGSNGAAKSAAIVPDLAVLFLEERLDRLLLNLPATDKSRIVESWLRGSI
jgi:hypothetical protein